MGSGDSTKVYETDYYQGIKASINVVDQLIFQQKEETAEELKTIIGGHHNDDTPITIEVIYVEAEWTKIGVRTGDVGMDNPEISKQVHANIAEELKRLKSHSLQSTSQKKIKKIPYLQATTQKQRFELPENKSKITQTQYDDLHSPKSETIATPIENDTDDAQETSDEQKKTEQSSAKSSEKDPDVQLPLSETVAIPTENDTDDALEISEQPEKQSPEDAESNNIIFIYYPESVLTIYSGSSRTLEDVISHLEENPSATADIRAYTDPSGNIDRNLSLSKKRVHEIRNYLILNGISEERITAKGLDAKNFLENNLSKELGSLNHPVEITIR